MDIVVTLPKSFGLAEWIAEGDLPGEEWSGTEWHFYLAGPVPKKVNPGDRVYVVYNGKLIGYSPLVRIEKTETGNALVRHNDAMAVTIDQYIPGFRGCRYRWWDREIEKPFTEWMVEKENGRWLEEYNSCGCSNVQRLKRELPGYCPIHGNSRKNIYHLIEEVECGLVN